MKAEMAIPNNKQNHLRIPLVPITRDHWILYHQDDRNK